MSLNSITRRMEKTARCMSRHHVDPETGEIMSLRIKQTGQRMSGVVAAMTRIDQANRTVMCGTGEMFARQTLRAVANCGGRTDRQIPVALTPVPVTYRKHRSVAVPVAA